MFDFNLDNVEILHKEKNYIKRSFAEMFYIKTCNSVNYRTDIDNLSQIYCNLISKYEMICGRPLGYKIDVNTRNWIITTNLVVGTCLIDCLYLEF